MKKILLFLAAICLFTSVQAQYDLATTSIDPKADAVAIKRMRHKMDSIRKYRPTVAVVLAGGGAKGAAHVGALEHIEELGIPVDMIIGTSMGGLVGGLYAMGYPAATIDSILVNMNWNVLLSDFVPTEKLNYYRRKYNEKYALRIPFYYEKDKKWSGKNLLKRYREQSRIDKDDEDVSSDIGEQALRHGLIDNMPEGYLYGYNVYNLINSLTVGYQDSMSFANLPIPYCCVAADLVSLKTKYWTSGSLPEAMRSTMSIPLYFTPVRNKRMVLVDGGTRNNFPADIARAMGADYIIGVDLSQPRTYDEINGIGKLLQQDIALMGKEAYDHNQPLADVIIRPDMQGMNMFSFQTKNIVECIERGRVAAQQQDSSLKVILRVLERKYSKKKKKMPPKNLPTAVNLATRDILIGDIRFDGISKELTDFLLLNMALDTNKRYKRDDIEDALAVIYGSGLFKNASYRVEGAQEPYTLVFQGERGPIHQLGAGLRINTRDAISLGLDFGYNRRKPNGFKFDVSAVVGKNLKGEFDLYYVPRRGPAFGLDVSTSFMQMRIDPLHSLVSDVILNTLCSYKYWNNRFQLYLSDNHWLHNGYYKAGLEYNVMPYFLYTFFASYAPEENTDDSEEMVVDDYDYILDGSAYFSKGRWDNHSVSVFVEGAYDNTDDKYFPTRGINVGGRYDLVFDSKTVDNARCRYHVLDLHINGAIPVVNRFVILLSGKMVAIQDLDFSSFNRDVALTSNIHIPYVGGPLDGELVPLQLSYVGYNVMQAMSSSNTTAVARMDLRYQIGRKDYISFIASLYKTYLLFDANGQRMHGVDYIRPTDYCFALQYGHKSFLGPMLFNVHWSRNGSPTRWGAYLSIGFDF